LTGLSIFAFFDSKFNFSALSTFIGKKPCDRGGLAALCQDCDYVQVLAGDEGEGEWGGVGENARTVSLKPHASNFALVLTLFLLEPTQNLIKRA
jgi:hypothetical protein